MYEIQRMTTRQRQGAKSRQAATYRVLIGIAEEVVANAKAALDKTAKLCGKESVCRDDDRRPARRDRALIAISAHG